MSKRTILTGVGSYVNKHGVPTFGFQGEEVDVNDDFLEEFDEHNVANGDGEQVTYERVGVSMISPVAAAQAAQQTIDPAVEQVSQQFGPYSSTVKYRSDSGSLWMYNAEWDYLAGLVGGDVSAAVSMRSPGF